MHSRGRLLNLAAAQAQRGAAAASSTPLEPAAALQAQPLTLLRLLSGSAASCSGISQQQDGAQPSLQALQQQQHLRWRQDERQRRRRLSHYSASTSGCATAAAAAAGLGGALRPYSSSSSSGGGARGSSPAGERTFASQPAYAYALPEEELEQEGPSFVLTPSAHQHPPPQQQQQRADELARTNASLRAQALSYHQAGTAYAAGDSNPMPRSKLYDNASSARGRDERQELVRVMNVEDFAPEVQHRLPIWQRLYRGGGGSGSAGPGGSSSSSGSSSGAGGPGVEEEHEASSILQSYQQEVLHGQDPEADSVAGPFAHTIPFLRNGLVAAQQGYCLQTDISRLRVVSWLPAHHHSRHSGEMALLDDNVDADGDEEELGWAAEPSERTAGAVNALSAVVGASRAVTLDEPEPAAAAAVAAGQGEEQQAAGQQAAGTAAAGTAAGSQAGLHLQQQLAQQQPAAAVAVAVAGDVPEAAAAVAGPAAGPAPPAAAAAAAAPDEEDEDEAFALAELLAWEQQYWEQQQAELQQAEEQLRQQGSREEIRKMAPPVPAASSDDVLAALGRLEGVRLEAIEDAVLSLYRPTTGRLWREYSCSSLLPLSQLTASQDPADSLRRMVDMAELLVHELGPAKFEELVNSAPWVLMLDGEKHGKPQLGCLHLIDMGQEQRAQAVLSHPRLLMTDVDGHLLPMFEYMQSLGMSHTQMARCLLQDKAYMRHSVLPKLKTAVAFWRGRGMQREDIVHMISAWPRTVHIAPTDAEAKLDWLVEHLGLTMADLKLFPDLISRSLTSVIGPRVAFAQKKGFKVMRPRDNMTMGNRLAGSQVSLMSLMRMKEDRVHTRLRADSEEYEEFKAEWMRSDFPAWIERRHRGIDYYRSFTTRLPPATSGAAPAASPPAAVEPPSPLRRRQAVGGRRRAAQA